MNRMLILSTVLLAALPAAYSQTKPITFGVSTVKPAHSATGGTRFFYTPSGLSIENITLQQVIRDAYQLEDDQLLNAPAWTKTAHYDIEAKVDDDDRDTLKKLSRADRAIMVQALLADRFHLKTHADTRELPVLNLVLARSGPKMTPTPPPPAGEEGKPRNQGIQSKRGELHAMNCPMEVFTHVLANVTHHLVVDKTALTGRYDFTLTYTDENTPASTEATAPSLYTALQEQLGLKLDATKAPMPVLVIDQIDQPTPD